MTSPRVPVPADLDTEAARIARTVRTEALALGLAANSALLDSPPRRWGIFDLNTTGTYAAGYVRSPAARYLRVCAAIAGATSGWAAVSVVLALTIRDGAGNTVTTSPDLPAGFLATTTHLPGALVGASRFDSELLVAGYLDLDALAATLVDPRWSFEWAVTLTGSGAMVNRIEGWEVPRGVVDDTATAGGVSLGDFQPDQPVSDGPLADPALRWGRIVQTVEQARTMGRTYVSLAWRQSTAPSDTPSVSSTSDAPFTLFDMGGSRLPIRVHARQLAAAGAAGEVVRWRILYRFTGGAGTETGQVILRGGATGSPWVLSSIAYTASWMWSPWQAAAVSTASDTDDFELSGKVSASGPSFFLSAVEVEEHVT